ncbi:glycosyltransferase 87 family protein [Gordonia polyisoprenivorans]|uniref:glycosyltransferase 87 family protein n=1 Tax=Gordonia polyisoprenivorans TaxID=84595 RepID=UPI002301A00E|nr:glycosyltransferase 87 family protein [Gordonia polyisoprenivorans]WCB38740.1 glycosyltransferase 87 family protein [Gordonia polyisoprenivorans]
MVIAAASLGQIAREHVREIQALTYAVFGVCAYLLFQVSGFDSHITWAHCAVAGYGVASAISLIPNERTLRIGRVAAITGALIVPFAMLLNVRHQTQNEVDIISQSGRLLLSSGVPYVHHATKLGEINPYLPFMAVFGIPRAVLAHFNISGAWNCLGDPRIWCALVVTASIAGSLRLLRIRRRTSVQMAAMIIASPTIALELCASGVDLPLTGLLLLGLTLVSIRRSALGGLSLGMAVAIKWVALLAIPVALVLTLFRFGKGQAARLMVAFLVTATICLIPAMLSPADAIAQVLEFPTGNGTVQTPAHSDMPGVLLAAQGRTGLAIDVALMAVAAIIFAIALIRRPPMTFPHAAIFLASGFLVFFLLAPVGRFGYLLVPMVFFGVAAISHLASGASARQLERLGGVIPCKQQGLRVAGGQGLWWHAGC